MAVLRKFILIFLISVPEVFFAGFIYGQFYGRYSRVAYVETLRQVNSPAVFSQLQTYDLESVENIRSIRITDRDLLSANHTNVLQYEAPSLLPHTKSPCFVTKDDKETLHMHCLPYVIQIGPQKCGTSQVYEDLKCHQNIRIDRRTMIRALEYNSVGKLADAVWNTTAAIVQCDPSLQSLIGKQLLSHNGLDEEIQLNMSLAADGSCDYVAADIYDGALTELDYWNNSPNNIESASFNILPRILHHLNPRSLFLGLFRDPVTRTLSDYQYFAGFHVWREVPRSPHEFHERVEMAIAWWHKCVTMYSERRCLYGHHFEGLNDTLPSHNKTHRWFPGASAVDRLRIGLYCLYLKDYFHWFPRSSFLFIRSEDYRSNRMAIYNNKILPFLGLPALDEDAKACTVRVGDVQNAFGRKPVVPFEKTIKMLQNFFRPYNKCFADMVGDDAFLWNY